MAVGSVSVTTIYTLHYLVRPRFLVLNILSNVKKKRPTAPYDTMGGTKMPTMLRTMATNVVVCSDGPPSPPRACISHKKVRMHMRLFCARWRDPGSLSKRACESVCRLKSESSSAMDGRSGRGEPFEEFVL